MDAEQTPPSTVVQLPCSIVQGSAQQTQGRVELKGKHGPEQWVWVNE